jgi:hypothetical protein
MSASVKIFVVVGPATHTTVDPAQTVVAPCQPRSSLEAARMAAHRYRPGGDMRMVVEYMAWIRKDDPVVSLAGLLGIQSTSN